MQYWLMKTEPSNWSWTDQATKKTTSWDGVRNYQAANNLKAMEVGDLCFFYHSVQEKQIMGTVRVIALAHPDSTALVPGEKVVWECVDVAPGRALPRPVTLEQVKVTPGLENMVLINNSRLSVQPVTDAEWEIILRLGGL